MIGQPGHGWTDERVEALKTHFTEGLTCSASAKLLGGCSRNAVISKRSRLGLSLSLQQVSDLRAMGGAIRARPAPKPRPASVPLPRPRAIPLPANATPVRLIALRPGQCKWPLDDPGVGRMDEALFCAAPADDGAPYCEGHAAVAAGVRTVSGKELARSLRRYA